MALPPSALFPSWLGQRSYISSLSEIQYLREALKKLSKRTTLVPWMMEEPTGPERLQQLFPTTATKQLTS